MLFFYIYIFKAQADSQPSHFNKESFVHLYIYVGKNSVFLKNTNTAFHEAPENVHLEKDTQL